MTTDFFSDDIRRDPYPLYGQMRSHSPVFHVPPPFDGWLIFDYEGVNRVLSDHLLFSSKVPAPRNWFIFYDPPQHTKMRALLSRAFTPKMVMGLEESIRDLSARLLDSVIEKGAMDLALDYAVPLPMQVIAGMVGLTASDWPRFRRWSDSILKLSYARTGGEAAEQSVREFTEVTAEMRNALQVMSEERRSKPREDLLTRLLGAEIDGERLSHEEILGFLQLLVVAGQETTANLINNAILCLTEHPEQLKELTNNLGLLGSAIEEVLRYRSPLQWVMRTPTRDVELHGQVIPAGKLMLPMIGSANRDEHQFKNAGQFDIRREPNPHIAFGHGIHSCLGAALARLEARIALPDLLSRLKNLRLDDAGHWEPRKALHVHGPASLPLHFEPGRRG
jgi:cytochrome P450